MKEIAGIFFCPESFFSLLWFLYLPLGQSWRYKHAACGAKRVTPYPGSPPGGWVCPQVSPLLLWAKWGVVGLQFQPSPSAQVALWDATLYSRPVRDLESGGSNHLFSHYP